MVQQFACAILEYTHCLNEIAHLPTGCISIVSFQNWNEQ